MIVTYFPNCSPSAIVSGNFCPVVSGKSSTKNPPIIANIPNKRYGSGLHQSPRMKMMGDSIPPIRPVAEQIPRLTFLKRMIIIIITSDDNNKTNDDDDEDDDELRRIKYRI